MFTLFADSLTLLNIFFFFFFRLSKIINFLASVFFIRGTIINYPLLYVILDSLPYFEYLYSGISTAWCLAPFEIVVPLLPSIVVIIIYGVPLTLIRRERGGGAVSRDILLYISFIVCWVGPPFF